MNWCKSFGCYLVPVSAKIPAKTISKEYSNNNNQKKQTTFFLANSIKMKVFFHLWLTSFRVPTKTSWVDPDEFQNFEKNCWLFSWQIGGIVGVPVFPTDFKLNSRFFFSFSFFNCEIDFCWKSNSGSWSEGIPGKFLGKVCWGLQNVVNLLV